MSPHALNRRQAAEFVGVSPTTFDKLVERGHMPKALWAKCDNLRPAEIQGFVRGFVSLTRRDR